MCVRGVCVCGGLCVYERGMCEAVCREGGMHVFVRGGYMCVRCVCEEECVRYV